MLLKTTSTFCTLRPFRAGGVFVRSLAGIFLRRNAIPARTVSPFAQKNKTSFFRTSQLIRSLSPSEIEHWQAARLHYNWFDSCGRSFTPEFPELFFSLNISAINLQVEPFIDPPHSRDVTPVSNFIFLEVTQFSMVLNYPGGGIPEHCILQVLACSPSYSPISENIKNYIAIGNFPDSTLPSFSVYNEYFAKFGQPLSGQYVRLAARLYTIESGLFSAMVYNSKEVS